MHGFGQPRNSAVGFTLSQQLSVIYPTSCVLVRSALTLKPAHSRS
jgi:hypothetical protein